MAIQYKNYGCGVHTNCGCVDKFGCPPGVCPDFTIRRHDTQPVLRVKIQDCGEPLDLTNRIVEVNMWAKSKLKNSINANDTLISFADAVGFEQVMAGDTIIMERVRNPEHMLVLGFNEITQMVLVQRGWNGTASSSWKKGTPLRIFRVMNSPAEVEMVHEDIEDIDGTITKNVLRESFFVYEWKPEDTCLPGCYWLEFKLLKMKGLSFYSPGGHWLGSYHQDGNGNFLTGPEYSDSSMVLSFQVDKDGKFLLPDGVWEGEYHLWSDGNYYSGTNHDEGSVYLNNTGIAADDSVGYNISGMIPSDPLLDYSQFSTVSVSEVSTTSFSQCQLGHGVEWVRRFPTEGDGFLIKIENSFTAEI